MDKKKLITIAVLAITIILALLAAFTAFKLYQIGKEPTTPKPTLAPKEPEVFQQEVMPCQLSFTVEEEAQCTELVDISVTDLSGSAVSIRVGSNLGYTNVELRITDTGGETNCYQGPTDCPGPSPFNWCWDSINIPYSEIDSIDFYVSVLTPCQDGEYCGVWTPTPSESPSASPSQSPSPSPSQSPPASPS
ncbi:hypothetical protein ACFLZ1_03420, partial [Patescibacteria group bacterium]